MNKIELIERIIEKHPHIYPKDAEAAVRMIIDHMSETLSHNGRVEIRGFGSFSLHYRPSRRARNPMTGEGVVTKDKFIPFFKPGKPMRDRINAAAQKSKKKALRKKAAKKPINKLRSKSALEIQLQQQLFKELNS